MSDGTTPALRVLHVAETLKGGIATYLDGLWHHQAQRYGAANLRLLAPAEEAGEVPAVPAAQFRPLPNRARGALAALRFCQAALRACAEWPPDVIHLHSTFAGAYVRTLRGLRLLSARIVYCPHGWSHERQSASLVRQAYRLAEAGLATQCEAVICISKSEYLAARQSWLPRRKCWLVYNGVPIDTLGDSAGGAPVAAAAPIRLLFVGRLDRQKGIDLLLAAMRDLRDRPLHLDVVGSPVLGDMATPADVPGNVSLLGWRDAGERDALMRRCDAVVIPSRWEGFGLVAVEAMRLGKPVVASRVGGLAEIVADRVTGLLVPPNDQAALTAALGTLSRDDLSAWGAAARTRAGRYFDLATTCERIDAVYRTVRR